MSSREEKIGLINKNSLQSFITIHLRPLWQIRTLVFFGGVLECCSVEFQDLSWVEMHRTLLNPPEYPPNPFVMTLTPDLCDLSQSSQLQCQHQLYLTYLKISRAWRNICLGSVAPCRRLNNRAESHGSLFNPGPTSQTRGDLPGQTRTRPGQLSAVL